MVEVKTRRITLTNTWRHGVSVVIRAVVATQKCKNKKKGRREASWSGWLGSGLVRSGRRSNRPLALSSCLRAFDSRGKQTPRRERKGRWWWGLSTAARVRDPEAKTNQPTKPSPPSASAEPLASSHHHRAAAFDAIHAMRPSSSPRGADTRPRALTRTHAPTRCVCAMSLTRNSGWLARRGGGCVFLFFLG